jgi:arsenate reductase
MQENKKIRVLFLCTHNKARSQMAEGILRYLGGDRFEVYSAGNEVAEAVHPMAVKALADMKIDISGKKPKHLNQFIDQTFDYIITVCDRANDNCPTFPNDPERIHWSLTDPAAFEGTDEEKQAEFNRIAMQLVSRVRIFVELPNPANQAPV